MNGKKTKILMVNTVPMGYDGIGMGILKYVANMDRNDMEVDVVVINRLDAGMRSRVENLGCKIYELTDRNTAPWKYVLSLRNVVRKGRYDVVHIHCNSCTAMVDLLGARLGKAKMLCPHSRNTKCEHFMIHRLLRPFFRLLYTDGFACGVDAGRWLFGEKPFTVWNNALDMDTYRFNRDERYRMRKELNLDDRTAIGHVANFNQQKNHTFLLDVFAEVVKCDGRYVLFLIGDGLLRESMETKARELGISQSVVFVGTYLNVPKYLNAMDLMVLPSLFEGLPNVVIEWQANGLPSLVADTVTKECDLTGSVTFIPLEEKVWVERILSMKSDCDRTMCSRNNCVRMAAAGYSIKEEAAKLKAYYIEKLLNRF